MYCVKLEPNAMHSFLFVRSAAHVVFETQLKCIAIICSLLLVGCVRRKKKKNNNTDQVRILFFMAVEAVVHSNKWAILFSLLVWHTRARLPNAHFFKEIFQLNRLSIWIDAASVALLKWPEIIWCDRSPNNPSKNYWWQHLHFLPFTARCLYCLLGHNHIAQNESAPII